MFLLFILMLLAQSCFFYIRAYVIGTSMISHTLPSSFLLTLTHTPHRAHRTTAHCMNIRIMNTRFIFTLASSLVILVCRQIRAAVAQLSTPPTCFPPWPNRVCVPAHSLYPTIHLLHAQTARKLEYI